MTDTNASGSAAAREAAPRGSSAGALLRAARERRGLSVDALAATVKVPPAKIEALESDRPETLPDLTFARGLARNVCHVLDVDPAPVLALMPQPPSLGAGLEQVHSGLRTPLRHGGAAVDWPRAARRPVLWTTVLVLLAALALFLMPQDWTERIRPADRPGERAATAPGTVSEDIAVALPPGRARVEHGGNAPAPAAAAPVAPASSAAPAAVPATVATPAPATASAPAAAPLVQLRADEEAWVEVREAGGRVLVQRLLRAGETVEADGAPPLRLKIGNASSVRLSFRGEPVDLAPWSRSDVARLELK